MSTVTTQSVKGKYDKLTQHRNMPLDVAYNAANLTIPTTLDWDQSVRRHQVHQSMGYEGVTSMVGHLLATLFPPNLPFARLSVPTLKAQMEQADFSEVQAVLSGLERDLNDKIAEKGYREKVGLAIEHLLITGNAVIQYRKDGTLKFHPFNRFVVQRDYDGDLYSLITKEVVTYETLPAAVREKLEIFKMFNPGKGGSSTPENNIEVYRYVRWDVTEGMWIEDVEIEGVDFPDLRETYKNTEELPWIVLRYKAKGDKVYGIGLVEDLIPDLATLDALYKSLADSSEALSRLIVLVSPNGVTEARDIATAPNGAVRSGNANDVSFVTSTKGGDIQIALATIEMIEARLKRIFMMTSGVVRNAERVTAEEIRLLALSLANSLGVQYAALANDLQLPLARLTMAYMRRTGELPELPEDWVKLRITTGVQGLGRGTDLSNLQTLLSMSAAIPDFYSVVDTKDLVSQLVSALGISSQGLLLTTEEIQSRQLQQQATQMAQNVAPRMV